MRNFTLSAALFILFIGISCAQKVDMTSNNPTQISLRFLALGDSYTIGESVSESERWPVQLADSLSSKDIVVQETNIIATTGWTTDELLAGINEASPDSSYNLVSLLIGVNNQYRGYEISKYREEFELLLNKAITFAGGNAQRVFVVSIPNYGVTPFGKQRGEDRIRQELLEYDAIADSIAASYGIPFVNITPISEEAKEDETLVADDNLHPSGKQYTLWVEEILPVVLQLLEQ